MIDITKIPIYCINLNSRPHRYLRFLQQEGIKGLTIQRIPAIDGSTLQISQNSKISLQTQYNIINHTRRSHGEINTPGAIGCSLSHYFIWEKFLQSNQPYCLVLEDDASIPKGFTESIANCSKSLQEITSIFDVWSLSYRLYDTRVNVLSSSWNSPAYFWGTSSYILSRNGAIQLLKDFLPIESHLDKYMCLKNSLGSLKVIIHSTFKTNTLNYGSDIQLYKCHLCDLPDSFEDSVLLHKYIVYAACVYGISLTLLFALHTNG
jgi:hypothetical protein